MIDHDTLNEFMHVDVLGKKIEDASMTCRLPLMDDCPYADREDFDDGCDLQCPSYVPDIPSYTAGDDIVRAMVLDEIEKAGIDEDGLEFIDLVINKLITPHSKFTTQWKILLRASIADIIEAFYIVKKGDPDETRN